MNADGSISGAYSFWESLGFPTGTPKFWGGEFNSAVIGVSSADQAALDSGQAVNLQVHSRCLTWDDFKTWKGAVIRVLERYYELTN